MTSRAMTRMLLGLGALLAWGVCAVPAFRVTWPRLHSAPPEVSRT